MLVTLAINLVLSAIKESFKNPEKKQKLRTILLNVRDQINLLYPDSQA